MSDIFEQKPWLNDDPQTVDTLKKNLGIDGGSGLPEIGSGDNGKVLTASVDGDTKEATWETPSGGGGGVIYVTESLDVLSATYNEITTAIRNGLYVIRNQFNQFAPLYKASNVGDDCSVKFMVLYMDPDTGTITVGLEEYISDSPDGDLTLN